jgi:hypothetical protein
VQRLIASCLNDDCQHAALITPPYRQGSFGERFYTDARRSASASFLINPPSQHDSKQGACTMKTKIIIAAILITLGADAAYAQRIARVTSDWESRSRKSRSLAQPRGHIVEATL